MSQALKDKLYLIIFESDTKAGKIYDVCLIICVVLSSLLIMLESINSLAMTHMRFFNYSECFFVILFSVEYLLRLYIVKSPKSYALSFYGIVDLLSILPAYVGLFLHGVQFLMILRVFRLLRLFRVFKMARHVEESGTLMQALKASRPKITVFLFTIMSVVIFTGALMYVVEGPQNGFNNIPEAVYWAIVTVSTVGYGDISPQTPVGKLISSVLMIIGYGIIAVPTGIITTELSNASRNPTKNITCPKCFSEQHAADAQYCNQCGAEL